MVVRKVSADGTITTFAGTQREKSFGDGGPATAAGVPDPNSVALDGRGNVYIIEVCVSARLSRDGTITTIAGTGERGFSGDGVPPPRRA